MYTPNFDRARTDPWRCIDAPVPRGHFWYFAYGSNMSIEQLRLRVGEPARHTLVVIPHWAMAITKPSKKAPLGYANIFPHPDPIQILASEIQQQSEMQHSQPAAPTSTSTTASSAIPIAPLTASVVPSSSCLSSPIHQKIVKNKARSGSMALSGFTNGGCNGGYQPPGSPTTLDVSQESLPSKASSSSLSRMANALISHPTPPSTPPHHAATGDHATNNNNNCGDVNHSSHRHVACETALYLETPEIRNRGISAPHHNVPTTTPTNDHTHKVNNLPCDNESGRIADCPPYVVCTAYLLNEDQLRLMDTFEGAPQHYRRVELSALAMQLPKSWLEAPALDLESSNISGLHAEIKMGFQNGSQTTPDSSGDVLGASSSTTTNSSVTHIAGVSMSALETAAATAALSNSGRGGGNAFRNNNNTGDDTIASPQFGDLSPLELLERVVRDYGANEPRSGLGVLRGSTYDDDQDPLHSALESEAANSYDNSLVVHSNDEAASILTRITGVAYIFGCVPSSDSLSGSSSASSPLTALSPEVNVIRRSSSLPPTSSTSRFVSSSIDSTSASQLGLNAGLGSPTSCGTGMAVIDAVEEAPVGVPPRSTVSVLTSLSTPSSLQAQMNNNTTTTTKHQSSTSSTAQLSCLPLYSMRGVPQFPIPGTTPPISAVDVGCVLMPSSGYLGRIREGINPIKNHILLISLFTSSMRRVGAAMQLSPGSVARCNAVRELLVRYVDYLEGIEPSAVESPRNQLREAGKV